MSKRTNTAAFVVERKTEDGQWFTHSYEVNERLAKQAARNCATYHHCEARIRDNPNLPEGKSE